MSRRVTRCLTWGEMRRSGSPLVDANGRRVGFIDWAEYVTLCGKHDEDPHEACAFDGGKPRAEGVCPRCWSVFRRETLDMLRYPNAVDEVVGRIDSALGVG